MVTVPTILYYAGTLFIVELEARKYVSTPPIPKPNRPAR